MTILRFHCQKRGSGGGGGSIPGRGTKIPQAAGCGHKKKKDLQLEPQDKEKSLKSFKQGNDRYSTSLSESSVLPPSLGSGSKAPRRLCPIKFLAPRFKNASKLKKKIVELLNEN